MDLLRTSDEKKAGAMTSSPHSPGQNAELTVHEEGLGTIVVEVRGELTRDGRLERFRSAIERQWDDDTREIRVDLSKATAIDLQGLGALLALRRRCGQRGAAFVVDNPRGSVRSRLEQTGTLEYLGGGGGRSTPLFG
jgi:anti-anti-sigma factor